MADFDRKQLVTIQLLQEKEVQAYANENMQIANVRTAVQVNSPLNFLRITTRSNSLVSALNTNAFISLVNDVGRTDIFIHSTRYVDKNASQDFFFQSPPCYLVDSTTPAGFYILSSYDSAYRHEYWPYKPDYYEFNASVLVDGFFGGCTPLDALLTSTLDCLYDINCLQTFPAYFPALQRVRLYNIVFYAKTVFI